jgi:hypothetical protein
MNHAHIREDVLAIHAHPLEKEPGGVEGVVLLRRDFLLIMTVNYQKREETLEFQAASGTTITSADVGIGSVVFTFQVGDKKTKEEVSVLSLRQLDSRVRRRVRDARELAA